MYTTGSRRAAPLFAVAVGLWMLAGCGGAGGSEADSWQFAGPDAGGDSPDVGVSEEVEIRELDDSRKLSVCEALGEHVLERTSKEQYCRWLAQSPQSEPLPPEGDGVPEDDAAARNRCEEAKQHCDEQVAVYPDNSCRQLNQVTEGCSATVGEWKRCVVEFTRIGVEQMNQAPRCDEVTAEHYAEESSCERPEACAKLQRKCGRLSALYGVGMVGFHGCRYPDDSVLSP